MQCDASPYTEIRDAPGHVRQCTEMHDACNVQRDARQCAEMRVSCDGSMRGNKVAQFLRGFARLCGAMHGAGDLARQNGTASGCEAPASGYGSDIHMLLNAASGVLSDALHRSFQCNSREEFLRLVVCQSSEPEVSQLTLGATK